MNNELSYADRTKIVKDWAVQFPEMVIDRRTMTIWKRIGPLLTYITVYTKKETQPSYHLQWAIHRLYEKMPGAGSMSLLYGWKWIHYRIDRLPSNWSNWTLDKQQEYVESKNRSYAKRSTHYYYYLEAADDIRKNSWIKTEGAVTLDDIWQGAKKHFECSLDPYKGLSFNAHEGFIPIFTAIWAGENEKAQFYFETWKNWALEHDEGCIKRNPENVISESMKRQREKYTELMFHYMNYPEELRQIVKDEVIAHKLEKVLYQNIKGVRYRE